MPGKDSINVHPEMTMIFVLVYFQLKLETVDFDGFIAVGDV
jgi:hypothetical protein